MAQIASTQCSGERSCFAMINSTLPVGHIDRNGSYLRSVSLVCILPRRHRGVQSFVRGGQEEP